MGLLLLLLLLQGDDLYGRLINLRTEGRLLLLHLLQLQLVTRDLVDGESFQKQSLKNPQRSHALSWLCLWRTV